MTDNKNLDRDNLSFSQAHGYEPLPQPLALEEVSDDARRKLWDLLCYSALRPETLGDFVYVTNPWRVIFEDLHVQFVQLPLDTYTPRAKVVQQLYRELVLVDLPFFRLFDFLQIIMRHPLCPYDFADNVAYIFRENLLAYVVDANDPPTILPAATPQEGKALQGAPKQLQEGKYAGAETHLREAGVQINAGEWAESVRESIHAVESVARVLDPKHANSLDAALKSLEAQIRIHPALNDAFKKLYGYSSDEQGIRHPLLDANESPVGRGEAVFMLGACASFVTYLLGQHHPGASA